MEEIILVDEKDNEIGSCEKLEAHKKGLLHRAFSIIIFNSRHEFLLQRRALTKYHCPGLWSNACCSHPRINETLQNAIHRRLVEEMGFDCYLKKKFVFNYKVSFSNGLIENEIDHVFLGRYDRKIDFNKAEVEEVKWVNFKDLIKDIKENPENYTPWLKIIVNFLEMG